MQKKLIALAVASLASGAAFAQTNVTMYGIADAGYVYSWGDAVWLAPDLTTRCQHQGHQHLQRHPVGPAGGSRLGFKGEEALGNGLKAIFTLEYSLNIDNNSGVGSAGGLAARQQFVGLSGANLGYRRPGSSVCPGLWQRSTMTRFGGALFSNRNPF
jgi:predicted porin